MDKAPRESTILIVDDVPENIDVLSGILGSEYRVKAALNGEKALRIAASGCSPDLILLDIMMPGMDGYQVCQKLKAEKGTQNIPVMFVTALGEVEDEQKGLELGAVDYITKPISPPIVKARVHNHLILKKHQDQLEELVKERTREVVNTQDVTIHSLAVLAETRDNETGGHIMRTQGYVRLLAEHLQEHPNYRDFLGNENIHLLYKSAPLHDIGKVGIADSILLKPGSLTKEEFAEMKKHTVYGRDAILKGEESLLGDATTSFLRVAREIAYTHHEKWDGSGYPQGLVGEEIPVAGRLMVVADIYDALISKRVYKPVFSHARAVQIITEGDGRVIPEHFDPVVLEAFVALQEGFREVALRFADFDEEREMLVG